MTDKKTFLIAVREYKEFIRTKTFWIGILSFPLIFAVAIFVPRWLEKTKDVRKYAVVDQSDWLLEAAEKRAAIPDLETLFRALRDGKIDFEKVGVPPEDARQIQPMLDKFSQLSDTDIKLAAEQMTNLLTPGGTPPQLDKYIPDFEKFREQALAAFQQLAQWYSKLNPGESRKVSSNLSKGRYQKIEVEGEGEDLVETLNQMVRDDQLFAYFVIGADPVEGSGGCQYVSKNLTDDDLKRWLAGYATAEVRSRRMVREDIKAETAAFIQQPLVFEPFDISKTTATGELKKVQAEDKARGFAPMAFVYLLWIAVFTVAQMLLTNTIEEKSNRIIEVLMSSASPFQIMSGKIAGIAATGLTVILSWVLFAYAGIKWGIPLLLGNVKLDLSFIVSDPLFLSSFVAYFLAGYLLYAAILVGMGSVCNSLKEAQNLMQPVMLILIVPLLAMMFISQDPNGTLATFLSYIPLFTPFVMMNRAAGPPPMHDYVITSIILVLTILVAFWAAAKVFRIGILMTGKPPKIREILRWIRAPIGSVPAQADLSPEAE